MLTVTCENDEILEIDLPPLLEKSSNLSIASNKKANSFILVSPSGDKSGITDANNIENAMNIAKLDGKTVFLSDGDTNTNDLFYVSRNIVVDKFQGSLIGENIYNTIIQAGRQSSMLGFSGAYSSVWTEQALGNFLPATVLQLDNAIGNVIIKNFSIEAKDNKPTNVSPDFYNYPSTYIETFIEIIGGKHDTTIENVVLKGKETNAFGNIQGMNVAWGIHVMPWIDTQTPYQATKGNLTIKNVTFENLGYDAILFMDFNDGSDIEIKGIKAFNVGSGLTMARISNATINIYDSHFKIKPQGQRTIQAFFINDGLSITGNTMANTQSDLSILFVNVSNSNISNNRFENVQSSVAAIILGGSSNKNTVTNNHYEKSNLPGWTIDTPNGPGAVLLGGGTFNNFISETHFPKGFNLTLCDMILDFGQNEIKNWDKFCTEPTTLSKNKYEVNIELQSKNYKTKFKTYLN